MPLPARPDIIRTAIVQQLHGQDVINVVNWLFPATVTESQVEDIAGFAASHWDANVMAFVSFQQTLVRVEARQAVPLSGIGFDFPVIPPAEGESTANARNAATATVISLRTGRAGRSFRGRLFIGGTPETALVNGLVDATYRNGLATAVNDFFQGVVDEMGCQPVVLSYFNAGVQRPAAVATPINSVLSVTPYPAGQERRRPGIGS